MRSQLKRFNSKKLLLNQARYLELMKKRKKNRLRLSLLNLRKAKSNWSIQPSWPGVPPVTRATSKCHQRALSRRAQEMMSLRLKRKIRKTKRRDANE
jgi:hypothetical protein